MIKKILLCLLCCSFLAHAGEGYGGGGDGDGGGGDGWGGDGGSSSDGGDAQSVSVTGERGGWGQNGSGGPSGDNGGGSSAQASLALVYNVAQAVSEEEIKQVTIIGQRITPFIDKAARSVTELAKYEQYPLGPSSSVAEEYARRAAFIMGILGSYSTDHAIAALQAVQDLKLLALAIAQAAQEQNISIDRLQEIVTLLTTPQTPTFDVGFFNNGDAYRGNGISPYSPEARAVELLSVLGFWERVTAIGMTIELMRAQALPDVVIDPNPPQAPPPPPLEPTPAPPPPPTKKPNQNCGRNYYCNEP